MKKLMSIALILSLAFSPTLVRAEVAKEATRLDQELNKYFETTELKLRENGIKIFSSSNTNLQIRLSEALVAGDFILDSEIKGSQNTLLRLKKMDSNMEEGKFKFAVALLQSDKLSTAGVTTAEFDMNISADENIAKITQSLKGLSTNASKPDKLNDRVPADDLEAVIFVGLIITYVASLIMGMFAALALLYIVGSVGNAVVAGGKPLLKKIVPTAKLAQKSMNSYMAKAKTAWKKSNKKELETRLVAYSMLALLGYLAVEKALEAKANIK